MTQCPNCGGYKTFSRSYLIDPATGKESGGGLGVLWSLRQVALVVAMVVAPLVVGLNGSPEMYFFPFFNRQPKLLVHYVHHHDIPQLKHPC
jgi:hypothetical protein